MTDYRLVDKDLVTESSLNRVVGAQPGDVNVLLKVRAAERMILTIQPEARVELVEDWIEADAGDLAVASADIVFSCVDRDLSRIGLIERCIAHGVPFFDLATDTDNRTGLAYGGRVLFSGHRERCPFCMDLLDQNELRADTLTAAMREAHDRIYGVKRDDRIQYDIAPDATDVLDREPADREQQRDHATALRACDRVLEQQRDLPGLDLGGL